MTNHYLIAALTVAMCIPSTSLLAQPTEPKQALQNLNELPNQFTVPITSEGTPAPGKRVWQRIESYQGSSIAYALYLPTDWQAGKKYPVIFEFPGNGGFRNELGDSSDGTVDGCRLGYGLSQGKEAIWVCLPFVDRAKGQHALHWWGDADATASYCLEAVEIVCQHWGGDRDRLVLCGFSRGLSQPATSVCAMIKSPAYGAD